MRNDLAVPYSWLVNPVSNQSADFVNVMQWLSRYGVKVSFMKDAVSGAYVWYKPSISYIVLSSGGFTAPIDGPMPGPIMQLKFDEYVSPMDADLVMNAPGLVIALAGLDGGNSPNYPPPVPPVIITVTPSTQPSNPIGAQTSPTQFNAATGDQSPSGAVYTDGRGTFVKSIITGPFESGWSWWTLTTAK